MKNSGNGTFFERIARSLRIAGMITRESLRSFLDNNDFEMSAALATYSFFALVPLLFFVINAVAGNGHFSAMIVDGIEGLIDHLFPRIREWMSLEFSVVTQNRVTVGIAAMVMVFVAAMSLVDSLRTTFFKIFKKDPPSSFVATQLGNIRSALIMLFLFVVLTGAELIFNHLSSRGMAVSETRNVIISVAVATGCMGFFYSIFLPIRLRFVKLFGASLISAVLIIAMREIFAFVLERNPSYGETFGSLKVLFVMIAWVYYCFLVILFGAEVAVNTEKRDALLLKGLFAGQMPGRTPSSLFDRYITHHAAGDTIFNEGDAGGTMFYVIEGAVDINSKGRHIRTMAAGEYFGEMSMLLGTKRTAAATASQETKLILISQDNFNIILRENAPIVLSLLKEIAGRLKDTDESLFHR
jgi:membrane protein